MTTPAPSAIELQPASPANGRNVEAPKNGNANNGKGSESAGKLSSRTAEGNSDLPTGRPRRKSKEKKSQPKRPTVSIECACGKVTKVVESGRTRKIRCRDCQAELLSPGTEDQTTTAGAAKRLYEAIQDALKKPITKEGESESTPGRKLSARGLARLEKLLINLLANLLKK